MTINQATVVSFSDSKLIYTDTNVDDVDLGITEWDPVLFMGNPLPRLVKFMADPLPDGRVPLYRYSLDGYARPSPLTPGVERLRKKYAPKANHVVVQQYRGGSEYISAHSDKVLDIRPNTDIVVLSLGAPRRMVFTHKIRKALGPGAADSVKLGLCAGSVLTLGPKTNMNYVHCIPIQKCVTETRTSLTFRQVASYFDESTRVVSGQGAAFQETASSERLIEAFARQNRATLADFCWDDVYGNREEVYGFPNDDAVCAFD